MDARWPRWPAGPAIDDRLTMRPAPRSRMWRPAMRQPKKLPRRLTAITSSHSPAVDVPERGRRRQRGVVDHQVDGAEVLHGGLEAALEARPRRAHRAPSRCSGGRRPRRPRRHRLDGLQRRCRSASRRHPPAASPTRDGGAQALPRTRRRKPLARDSENIVVSRLAARARRGRRGPRSARSRRARAACTSAPCRSRCAAGRRAGRRSAAPRSTAGGPRRSGELARRRWRCPGPRTSAAITSSSASSEPTG